MKFARVGLLGPLRGANWPIGIVDRRGRWRTSSAVWPREPIDALPSYEAVEGGLQRVRLRHVRILRAYRAPAHSGPARLTEQCVKLSFKVHAWILPTSRRRAESMNCHLFAATSIDLHFTKAWEKFSANCRFCKPRESTADPKERARVSL